MQRWWKPLRRALLREMKKLVQSEFQSRLSYHPWLTSGHRSLLISHPSFGSTDEKHDGKEPETESEFVDIKGIYLSFPQLHTLNYLLGTYHLGQRSVGTLYVLWGS